MTTLRYIGAATKRGTVQRVAEKPRVQVPNFVPTTFASTIFVASGGDIQAVINSILDTTGNVRIKLQAGGTYSGFVMVKRNGPGYVVIDTEDVVPVLGGLPALDPVTGRMTPAYATAYNLATIVYNGFSTGAVTFYETAPDVPTRWVVRRLRVTAPANTATFNPLINCGEGSSTPNSVGDLPSWIAIHQNYVKGIDDIGVAGAPKGCRVGIGVEGTMIRVTGNWIENMHMGEYGEDGIYDAQAIRSFYGPGPVLLENNFGESNSECLGIGGAGALLAEGQLTMADYTIRFNHFYKRLSWLSPAGEGYTTAHANHRHGCKNGVELKQGRRVWFYANIIENVWCDQQHGQAFVIYSIDQSSIAPFLTSQDVTIEYTWMKNCFAGVGLATTYPFPYDTLHTMRATVRNNIMTGVRDPSLYSDTYNGDYNTAAALNIAIDNVRFEHNTILSNDFHSTWIIESIDADVIPIIGWSFKDNIVSLPNDINAKVWVDARQITLGGAPPGDFSLTQNSEWDYNLGCDPQANGVTHPTVGTHDVWVTTNAGLGLVNAARAYDMSCTLAQLSDLKPAAATPGRLSASDGTDRGADIDTIQTLLATVRASTADLPV